MDPQSLLDTSNKATQTYVDYASAGSLLPAKLRQAVQEKLDYNRDIINEKNKAAAEYFKAPAVAREKYSNIWNPMEREKLVAESRAQAYTPYANASDILAERRGSIDDLIKAATGAFGAEVTAKQGAAEIAQKNFGNALDLYKATHPAGGGDSSVAAGLLTALAEAIARITGKNEPKPTNFPITDWAPGQPVDTNRTYTSPQGQWNWNYQPMDWVRTGQKPRLYDPKTQQTIEYDSYTDPDYIEDSTRKGFTHL